VLDATEIARYSIKENPPGERLTEIVVLPLLETVEESFDKLLA